MEDHIDLIRELYDFAEIHWVAFLKVCEEKGISSDEVEEEMEALGETLMA